MKYTVNYSRKVRAGPKYEVLEIGVFLESDTGVEPIEAAYGRIRAFVDEQVDRARERLSEKAVPKPEAT